MHIITRKRLTEFAQLKDMTAKPALDRWFRRMKQNSFRTPNELLQVFSSHEVDQVGKLTVFNIGGKTAARLITAIHYNRQKVFIRDVLTHTEYETGKWREVRMIKENSNEFTVNPTIETVNPHSATFSLSIVTAVENLIEAVGKGETKLFSSLTEDDYEKLVSILDGLIDEIGNDENHILATVMEFIAILIQNYEDEYVPELIEIQV